ncbi:DUF1566 domain-containing protein [uncultured Desulfobulbus sp.]|uniref:Lcl C-terminal domain-containing protein n=1 Tax=uncultured Desulfobulbus sp. TaxID=239745 RepID=UPI0029C61F74|nr:DUF1566 domain-containing protein [uncultured Desulfobulbus sp.]
MDLFEQLDISETAVRAFDLEMTPDLAYRMFTCSGFHEEQCSTKQRVLYCYVDTWGETPKLLLMEQGVKYARVLAQINAPDETVRACVANPETTSILRRVHALDAPLKQWLQIHLVEDKGVGYLQLLIKTREADLCTDGLPLLGTFSFTGRQYLLPSEAQSLNEAQMEAEIKTWNFFESQRRPQGGIASFLIDNGDSLTVTDAYTGLTWQLGGLELASLRTIKSATEQLREQGFAGWHDWRLPTLHEAMSLLLPERNVKGLYMHPCFSNEQPFIFTAARCHPGGYWLVDYRQGRVFRGSGSSPGAFARLCRTNA